ncbi:MAG TPA: substrate-binding domain-containing protein [Gaiellaceae bacterium]|nr:substrate-binding domain-containing protein [Gaiellaceae bacterium]
MWFVDGFSFVPAWQKMEAQFKAEAAKLGDKATVVGMSALNPATMVSDMDQAIANHANAILFCDVDPATFKAEIAKARAAGIVVTTIGCVDTLSNYSIGTDNVAYGRYAADVVGKKLHGSGEIGFDGTTRTTPNQILQVKGFKEEAAKKYPGIKVVAWEQGEGNTATDQKVITAMLEGYPKLKAVVCITSTCPPAAQAALSAAGKKAGQIFFLGIDHDPATIAGIKSGWVSETIAQCWFDAGPFALDLMQAALDGHANAKQSWAMPTQVVTKAQLPYPGCPAKLIPTVTP